MFKKVMVSVTSLSVLALVGCNSNSDGNNESGSSSGETVELRFATWDNEDSLTFQEDLVREFNESQDGIEVKLEAYGSEFDTILTAGFGASDAPDVMYMWNYPTYHQALEPLDSYIESEGADYKNNFYDTTWNYNSIDGDIYGIPVGFTTHVLYYNKDLFDEAGVDYPTSDWTWDDIYQASSEISDLGDNIYGYVLPTTPDPYDFEMFLWSNNGSYTDDEGTFSGNLNSPESIEVFEHFQGMLNDGVAVASEGSGRDEITSGTAAMIVNGSWEINALNNAGINYGMVEIPSFNSRESVSILSSSGLSIAEESDNKDAAWEFVKFWTNEEANIARLDYELPVLHSVVESEGIEDSERYVFYSMLERSEEFQPTSFSVENWSSISDDLSQAFEEIFNPTRLSDPETILNTVAE